METREFPVAVIASISSGICLCKFDELHEAAEYLMGHSQDKVLEQCPGMPTNIQGVTPDNYQERVAALEAALGAVATIRKGTGETAMHPLDGIPDGKPTILLAKD